MQLNSISFRHLKQPSCLFSSPIFPFNSCLWRHNQLFDSKQTTYVETHANWIKYLNDTRWSHSPPRHEFQPIQPGGGRRREWSLAGNPKSFSMQRYSGVNLSPKSKHTCGTGINPPRHYFQYPGIVVSRFGYVRTADLAGDACASQVASDLRDAQCIPTFFHEPISREEFETASPHFRSRPRAGNAKLGCLRRAFPESL